MSLRLFPCYRRFRLLGPQHSVSATRNSASNAAPVHKSPSIFNKTRRHGFGLIIVSSALGFWLWHASNSRGPALRPLSTEYFIPSDLTSSEKTTKSTKLLRLVVSPEVIKKVPESGFRPIWSVYVKDSDIQVERPYTPLEGLLSNGEMLFWIKKYEHGEVGRWLHNRTAGEKIEIRGPEQTWSWKDGIWDNVIMVAGGTGIAPFYQLLHMVFSDPTRDTNTRFTLLQSYRSPEELPPPRILDNLTAWRKQNPEKLKIRSFVDRLDDDASKDNLSVRRISEADLKSSLKAVNGGKTIVLICGPDPMISALAGPKGRDQSQGPIGGVLGSLNDGTFQVWKL